MSNELSVTAKDLEKLLRKWGFNFDRIKGGHAIWKAPSGKTVSVTAVGHKAAVHIPMVKQLADAAGLTSYREFLKGPQ